MPKRRKPEPSETSLALSEEEEEEYQEQGMRLDPNWIQYLMDFKIMDFKPPLQQDSVPNVDAKGNKIQLHCDFVSGLFLIVPPDITSCPVCRNRHDYLKQQTSITQHLVDLRVADCLIGLILEYAQEGNFNTFHSLATMLATHSQEVPLHAQWLRSPHLSLEELLAPNYDDHIRAIEEIYNIHLDQCSYKVLSYDQYLCVSLKQNEHFFLQKVRALYTSLPTYKSLRNVLTQQPPAGPLAILAEFYKGLESVRECELSLDFKIAKAILTTLFCLLFYDHNFGFIVINLLDNLFQFPTYYRCTNEWYRTVSRYLGDLRNRKLSLENFWKSILKRQTLTGTKLNPYIDIVADGSKVLCRD